MCCGLGRLKMDTQGHWERQVRSCGGLVVRLTGSGGTDTKVVPNFIRTTLLQQMDGKHDGTEVPPHDIQTASPLT